MIVTLARLAPALALVALCAQPAFAQGGGGGQMPKLPKPEEIEKQAKELLAQTETKTAELEGFVKITYKAIPSSTDEIGKLVGEKYKDQIPKGVDIDAALRQYGPQIQEALNKYLTEPEGWKFEALADLKWKSKKIPKGEYKISLDVDGEQLKTLILTQAETKDEKGKKIAAVAIPIHFKADKKQEEPFPKLKFDVKGIEDKKTKETKTFNIFCEFFRTSAKTTEPVKLDPPKDAKKTEPKKEDAPKKDEAK
jgi:hypothetical protein